MKPSILTQLSEAFSLSALLSLTLPLAFPIVAWIDGAQDEYQRWSILAMVLALFASMIPMAVCMALSNIFDSIEQSRFEREQDARALHAYLLNGGRA